MKLIALRSIQMGCGIYLPGQEFNLDDHDEITRLVNMIPPAAKFKMIIPAIEKKHPKDRFSANVKIAEKVQADNKEANGNKKDEFDENGDEDSVDNNENDLDSASDINDSPMQTEVGCIKNDQKGEDDQTTNTSDVNASVAQVESALKIDGIATDVCAILEKFKHDSVEKIKKAKLEDLVAIPGLGYKNAKKVFDRVQKL